MTQVFAADAADTGFCTYNARRLVRDDLADAGVTSDIGTLLVYAHKLFASLSTEAFAVDVGVTNDIGTLLVNSQKCFAGLSTQAFAVNAGWIINVWIDPEVIDV